MTEGDRFPPFGSHMKEIGSKSSQKIWLSRKTFFGELKKHVGRTQVVPNLGQVEVNLAQVGTKLIHTGPKFAQVGANMFRK